MGTENSSSPSKSLQMDLLLRMPKPSRILKPQFCTNTNIYINTFQTSNTLAENVQGQKCTLLVV